MSVSTSEALSFTELAPLHPMPGAVAYIRAEEFSCNSEYAGNTSSAYESAIRMLQDDLIYRDPRGKLTSLRFVQPRRTVHLSDLHRTEYYEYLRVRCHCDARCRKAQTTCSQGQETHFLSSFSRKQSVTANFS
jgi:hypothetical protein